MINKIIDGKKISLELKDKLKSEVELFKIKPTLVVISVGNDPASQVYVNQKEKCALDIGINYKHLKYDKINEDDLIKVIYELNNDYSVDGIIVQLPLIDGLNSNRIINEISPSKDVDGLTYLNAGKLLNNENCLVSCTPKGIMYLLKHENISLEGKNIVIIGRSNLVGKPMFNLLINENATVTLCHSKTKNIINYTKHADIIIVAVGKKHFLTSEMIKKNSIIIDVGINRENDKLYGDVLFDDVIKKVKKITPVPKGVGPMTVVMLMDNVICAYKNKRKS